MTRPDQTVLSVVDRSREIGCHAPMLRALLGVTVVSVVVASCGSDDARRKVRAEEGGAGGEAGAAGPAMLDAAGAGGEVSQAAGAGGFGNMAGAGAAAAGGAPASAGAPGQGGMGGEAVAGMCGEGTYDAGENGCVECPSSGELIQLTCADLYMPALLANGGPLSIRFSSLATVYEPLTSTVEVLYSTPDQGFPYELAWDPLSGRWTIDVSGGPRDSVELRVQPFTASGVCGETYQFADELIFTRIGVDDYVADCPGA